MSKHMHIGRRVLIGLDTTEQEVTIVDYRDLDGSHYMVEDDHGLSFWVRDDEIDFQAHHDSGPDTRAHIERVAQLLGFVCNNLYRRGMIHDASKLLEPEKSIFDLVVGELKGLKYGSPEYKAGTARLGDALKHHYAKNRHHIQHHPNGVEDMTLLDLIEMLADWKAAGEREGGTLTQSLEINRTRYTLPPLLWNIFANTAYEMCWIDEPLEHIDTGAIWRVDGFHDEYKNMCDVFFLTREQAVAYVEKELGECEWFEKHDTCWTARTGPHGVYIDIYKVPLGEKV